MPRGGRFQQCYVAPPHSDGHGKQRTWNAGKKDLHKNPERRDIVRLMLNNAKHAQRLATSTTLLHVQATQTAQGLPAAVPRPRRRTTCGGPRARGSSTRMIITLKALAHRSTASHPAATPDGANNAAAVPHINTGLPVHPVSNAGSPTGAPVGSAGHDGSMVGSVVVITTGHDNKGEPVKTDSPAGAHVLAADNNSTPAASLPPPSPPPACHTSLPHPPSLTSTLSARALLILHNLISAGYPASPATHATTPATPHSQLSQTSSDHRPLTSNDNNTVALANTGSSPHDAPSSAATPTDIPTAVADSSSQPATAPLTHTDVLTGNLPLWLGAIPARCGLGMVIASGSNITTQRDLRPLYARSKCKARSWPGYVCEIVPASPRQDPSVPAPRKTWPTSCTPIQCDEHLVGLHTPWKIQAVRPDTTNACGKPCGVDTLPLPLNHSREIDQGMYLPCTPRSDFEFGAAEEAVRASRLKLWIKVLPSCMRPMH